jgi:hypothetical protein
LIPSGGGEEDDREQARGYKGERIPDAGVKPAATRRKGGGAEI